MAPKSKRRKGSVDWGPLAETAIALPAALAARLRKRGAAGDDPEPRARGPARLRALLGPTDSPTAAAQAVQRHLPSTERGLAHLGSLQGPRGSQLARH